MQIILFPTKLFYFIILSSLSFLHLFYLHSMWARNNAVFNPLNLKLHLLVTFNIKDFTWKTYNTLNNSELSLQTSIVYLVSLATFQMNCWEFHSLRTSFNHVINLFDWLEKIKWSDIYTKVKIKVQRNEWKYMKQNIIFSSLLSSKLTPWHLTSSYHKQMLQRVSFNDVILLYFP